MTFENFKIQGRMGLGDEQMRSLNHALQPGPDLRAAT